MEFKNYVGSEFYRCFCCVFNNMSKEFIWVRKKRVLYGNVFKFSFKKIGCVCLKLLKNFFCDFMETLFKYVMKKC